MAKHVYRGLILIVVFFVTMVVTVGYADEKKFEIQATTEMADATFPILTIISEKQDINLLHGYGSNMNPNLIRDSITPLEEDQSFRVFITENEMVVKKLLYEVWDTSGKEMLDSGSISALEKEEDKKSAKIKIKAALEENTEYAVKLTTVTSTGKKIRFFTRVKYIKEDYRKEKLDFVLEFHNAIFDKKKAESIRTYLESDNSMDNATFAYVNIKSSFDLITWGQLKPIVISKVIPTIKEMNEATAAIQLNYMVKVENSKGQEEYNVMEFYRVQYTPNRMYLLAYERTMEAVYNPEKVSLSKNELKVGISQDVDMKIWKSEDNSKIAFVYERELWFYNLIENRAVKVFSFRQKETDYIRDIYNQHNIRILNMDESGNIDFMVYGYMNRGVYEGRVSIVLYHFYEAENRIEEQVYIPLETSYQILKEDLNTFSYVNQQDIFYFSIQGVIYAYNIPTKTLSIVAENITEETYLAPEETSLLVWQDSPEVSQAEKIFIMDLELGERREIKAPEGSILRLIGNIEENVIYGFARKTDLQKTTDGSDIIPIYQIIIISPEGTILKQYKKKEIYIMNTKVKDNIVELTRAEKREHDFIEIEPDYILSNIVVSPSAITITTRVTENMLTELYISLSSDYPLIEVPQIAETENTIIHHETVLRLALTEEPPEQYYVYILGSIWASYPQVSDAIQLANEKMGVVLNQKNQIIWERGGKKRQNSLSGIELIQASGGKDSVDACIQMILSYKYLNVDKQALSKDNRPITQRLDSYLEETVINLTGCTLEEALYFVSRQSPVLAMKDETHAVLIAGYDELNIIVYDPSKSQPWKISMNEAKKMFENAGNIFVSYIR